MGLVWYLIVSIPDLCTITYFYVAVSQEATALLAKSDSDVMFFLTKCSGTYNR